MLEDRSKYLVSISDISEDGNVYKDLFKLIKDDIAPIEKIEIQFGEEHSLVLDRNEFARGFTTSAKNIIGILGPYIK